MTERVDELAELRRLSPITQARMLAFRILGRHPDCLLDDTVLGDFLEDIAQAILTGVSPADGETEDKR